MKHRTAALPPNRASIAQTSTTLALTGAAAWIALATDSIVRPDAYRYRDGLLLVPWVLLAATLVCIHRLQREHAGSVERWGLRSLMASMAFVAVGNFDIVLRNADKNLAFPLGAVIFMGSLVAFGIGTARAGVLPRRVGLAIAASQLLTMATGLALSPLVPLHDYGSYSGGLAHGAVMLILAASLRTYARSADSIAPRRRPRLLISRRSCPRVISASR